MWSHLGIPSCWGAPWPLDIWQWGISWGHVSQDVHHDRVRFCIHQGIGQYLGTNLGTPWSSHQWTWWTWLLQGLWQAWLWPLWWKKVQDVCRVVWQWWHSSSSQLLVSHLRVDPGWQDQGCLQHTNMTLPCGAEHQDYLAAKWWVLRVCHIGVYGIHCRQWVWYWCGLGQWVGQLGRSDLHRGIKTHGGVIHCFQFWYQPWHGVRLSLFCWHLQAAIWWYMPHCIVNHGHLWPLSHLDGCVWLLHWVGCSVGLSHLEGCGPLLHLWCLSCCSTLGGCCGS